MIDLTAELIRDQQESGVEAAPAPAPAAKRSRFGPAVAETAAAVAAAATAAAMPPAPVVATGAASATAAVAGLPISTAGLPSVVAEQIKAAQAKQARAALQGAAPPMWAVGARAQPGLPVWDSLAGHSRDGGFRVRNSH